MIVFTSIIARQDIEHTVEQGNGVYTLTCLSKY